MQGSPLLSGLGAFKTVKARFWPGIAPFLGVKSLQHISSSFTFRSAAEWGDTSDFGVRGAGGVGRSEFGLRDELWCFGCRVQSAELWGALHDPDLWAEQERASEREKEFV